LKNQPLNDWQKQQQQIAHSTVGVCSGTIKHLWHGEKANRNYNRRIEILKQSNFCSDDIAIDSNGLWSWNTDKPQLHSDVAEYFSARKEDEIDKYTAFYNSGGWSYETAKEQRFFQKWFQQKFKLKSNARILELGCGMGFQSAVLADMGFDVTGLDVCQAGITAAKQRKSKASFICDSADNLCYRFPKRHFDCIYVRGMSWFHYELDRISAETNVDIRQKTKMFFEYLKPKGLFFLQIATDFSGEIKNHVLYNRLDKYIDLFAPLGNIVHVSNWAGVELHSQEQAEQVKGNIIIVTQAV
jgi:SAM-dependent methyltransferase